MVLVACHKLGQGRSWKIDCPMVLVACHKLGQGNRVHSLHVNKSASDKAKLEWFKRFQIIYVRTKIVVERM
jgi:hypothetical protein